MGMGQRLSHQTILHRTLRPLVGRLVRMPISPDGLTGLRLLTGLCAASCFACGTGCLSAGAGLFLLSMLLDRADGELARQSGRFSRFGGRFDLLTDCASTMAAFIGLGVGLAPGWRTPGIGYALGLLAAASTAFIFLRLNMPRTGVGAGGGRPLPCRPFDPDDAMLLVPLAIWCGGGSWILLASGVLTPIAALLVAATELAARRRALRLASTEQAAW